MPNMYTHKPATSSLIALRDSERYSRGSVSCGVLGSKENVRAAIQAVSLTNMSIALLLGTRTSAGNHQHRGQ